MTAVLESRTFPSGHVVTHVRQLRVLDLLAGAGVAGLTSREIAVVESSGDVSGVNTWGGPLTLLRQAGVIAALSERREGHHVYVLPEYVEGRAQWGGYRHGHCATCTCEGVSA